MNFSIINIVLAVFISIACLTLSYQLAFTDFMDGKIMGGKRILFIVILLSYCSFRIYRMVKSLKKS